MGKYMINSKVLSKRTASRLHRLASELPWLMPEHQPWKELGIRVQTPALICLHLGLGDYTQVTN